MTVPIATLADVVDVRPGRTPRGLDRYLSENPRPDRTVPFYKVGDMNLRPEGLREARTLLAQEELGALGLQTLPVGAVVFPKAGGAIATNKKRMVLCEGAIDLNCMGLVPGPEVHPTYLLLWFESFDLSDIADGSVLPQISKRTVSALQLPLPLLAEQRRIVEVLEDHLSRLDAARTYLNQVMRRAVSLEAALRSDARRGPERQLPDVAAVQGGIQKQQRRAPRDNAYPFLRVANVTAQGLDLSDVHNVELFGNELNRLRLQRGDLLVVEGNGSASQIGRAALWDGSIEDCVHQNHLIRVRPGPDLLPEYLEAVWNSPQSRAQLTHVASSSSGLHTLSVSKLNALTLPVPDLEQQQRITLKLRESQAGQRRLLQSAQEARTRAEVLRRAVLAAGFSGQLTGRHTDIEIIEGLSHV